MDLHTWRDIGRWLADNAPWLIALLVGVAIVAALLAVVVVARYEECRAHGFSAFYCATS